MYDLLIASSRVLGVTPPPGFEDVKPGTHDNEQAIASASSSMPQGVVEDLSEALASTDVAGASPRPPVWFWTLSPLLCWHSSLCL